MDINELINYYIKENEKLKPGEGSQGTDTPHDDDGFLENRGWI